MMIEDSEDDHDLILRRIKKEGYDPYCKRVETKNGLEKALKGQWDIVLSDQHMPSFDGFSALKVVREKNPIIPFLLISGNVTEQLAISALKQGASDYLFKDNLQRLVPVISRELKDFEIRKKQKEADELIRRNEYKLKQAHQLARSGHWEYCFANKAITLSDELVDILGLRENQLHPRGIFQLIHPGDRGSVFKALKMALENRNTTELTFRVFKKPNTVQHIFCRGKIIFDDNKPVFIQGIFQDVTRQYKSKMLIEKSLKENRLLLAEMHHRVKNNLATISSLLELQKMSSNNPDTQEALSRNTYFIYNLALVQEMLYKSSDFSSISFGLYLKKLVKMSDSLHNMNKRVNIDLHVDEAELSISKALPAALITNELLINSFKHAFKDGRPGKIIISMKRSNDKIRIGVEDNGRGFSQELDSSKDSTYGFTLINILVKQLKGTFSISGNGGMKAALEFDMKSNSNDINFKRSVYN